MVFEGDTGRHVRLEANLVLRDLHDAMQLRV